VNFYIVVNNIKKYFFALYFDKTMQEFNNIHSINENIILLVEDDSFVKSKFNDYGTQFKVIEFLEEEIMSYLADEYLLNELYSIIKNNYIKENWLLT